MRYDDREWMKWAGEPYSPKRMAIAALSILAGLALGKIVGLFVAAGWIPQ